MIEFDCRGRVLVIDGTWPLDRDAEEPALAVMVSQSAAATPAAVLDPRRQGGPEFADCFLWFIRDLLDRFMARGFELRVEYPVGVVVYDSAPRVETVDGLLAELIRVRKVSGANIYPVYFWLQPPRTSAGIARHHDGGLGPAADANDWDCARVSLLDFALDIVSGRRAALAVIEVLRDCARATDAGVITWNVERADG